MRRLGADVRKGLTQARATEYRQRYGYNEIREGRKRGPVAMFLAQFADFMILVLIAAAVVAGLIGDLADTFVIVTIVVLNAGIGFVQEYRAERAIAALRRLAALQAQVRRDGLPMVIPARDLVPGDTVVIEAGNAVPADIRIVEAAQLRIDESALTGESEGVDKVTSRIDDGDLPVGDRRNMAYKGTLVTHGRGRGVVVATGMHSELGRIAALLRLETSTTTPLQKRLERFGRLLAIAVLGICARDVRARRAARRAPAPHPAHGDQPGRGRDPRGAPRRRHGVARAGRTEDGRQERAHPQAASGRNTRLRHGHLLGQDRNAHRESDAGRSLLRERRSLERGALR